MNIYPIKSILGGQDKGHTAIGRKFSLFSVLVVEPDPIHQYIIGVNLNESRVHLEFSPSGKIALSIILGKQYNLILLDIPFFIHKKENIISAIRLLDAYKKIPLIGMTALLTEEVRRNTIESGLCEIIERPFTPERVLAHYLWLRKNKRRRKR